MKRHEKLISEFLKGQWDIDFFKKYHKEQIEIIQHERLIHLLVTLFFGLFFLISVLFAVVFMLAILSLAAVFLILLIPCYTSLLQAGKRSKNGITSTMK